MAFRGGCVVAVPTAVVLAVLPAPVRANGVPDTADGALTRFERFILNGCAPCVRETYPVAKLVVPPAPLPSLPRIPAGTGARPGQVDLDVVRAYAVGRTARQFLALRVTLSVVAGSEGQLFRLGSGHLDEDDVAQLASAMSDIARAARDPADATRESREVEYHNGSLRIGLIHLLDQSVAYVQVGSITAFALRPVWEVPSTLYLPVTELSSLAGAVAQVAGKMRELRGR
jgi:hypothetical protein